MAENPQREISKGNLRLAFALFALAGCTRLVVLPGLGKTQQTFATDRYDCAKESTHRGWGFNNYGGWGGEQVNEDLYFACMEARGHRVARQNKLTGSVAEP